MAPTPNPGLSICGRLYVLVIATAAITASVLMIFSCQFFSYETVSGQAYQNFGTPFDELSSASVGLFSYSELLTNTDKIPLFGDQCFTYDDWQSVNSNIYFKVAQWCAIVAPGIAFLAWIQVFFDMICCRLFCGFFLMSFFFFAAAAAQGFTFFIFAESEFCFVETDDVSSCKFKIGAWYSMGAAIAYLLLAIVTPTMPLSPNEQRKGLLIVKKSPTGDESGKSGDVEYEEEEEIVEEEVTEEEQSNKFCGVDLDDICGSPKEGASKTNETAKQAETK